jgi:AcrR family transcriptional regulator
VPEPLAGAIKRTRRLRSDGEQTLKRVLDAAVETILEEGYYRASSNEIARRAGVTWGVIQHQFGTRQGLLLEVLNDGWATLQQRLATAEVVGDSLEERLRSVLEILAEYYEQPSHLAHMQILLDLTENPKTNAETRAAVAAHGEELTKAWRPLFQAALGGAAEDHQLVSYAFVTLRGYLMGNALASRIAAPIDSTVTRDLLVRGVAAAIRSGAAERHLSLD